MGIIATSMPLITDTAGVWEGEYVHIDENHQEFDRHQARLLIRIDDESDTEARLRQTNIYTWSNNEHEIRYFEGNYRDDRIWFNNALIDGWTRTIDMDPTGRTMMVAWTRPAEPGFRYYEIIIFSEDGQSRNRTWHWYRNDRLFQRTLINEHKVSDDWRSFDEPHFYASQPRCAIPS